MKINENNIRKIRIEQFKKLLDSIGVIILRNNLIESSKSFPKNSMYYNGNKITGSFWNGFRKETLPKNKVDSFYVDEVYYYKNKLNIYDNFWKLILKKFKIEEENFELNNIEDVDVKIILSKILEIIISPEDLNESLKKSLDFKYQKTINDLKEEYEEKIKKIINKKEEEKREEIIKLENKYNNMIKVLNEKIEEKEESNKKLLSYEQKIKRIFNDIKIQDDLEKFILEKQMSTIDDVKKILKEGFEDIINKLDTNDDVSKLIVKQYIIYKLIKE